MGSGGKPGPALLFRGIRRFPVCSRSMTTWDPSSEQPLTNIARRSTTSRHGNPGERLNGCSRSVSIVILNDNRSMPMELNSKQRALCRQHEFDFSDLQALFINCTLKPSPEFSHTEALMSVSR